jgi:hypothetical protein
VDEIAINKTMDRDDLLSEPGRRFVSELSRLAETLEERRLPVTSWYGALPERERRARLAGFGRLPSGSSGSFGQRATSNESSAEATPTCPWRRSRRTTAIPGFFTGRRIG